VLLDSHSGGISNRPATTIQVDVARADAAFIRVGGATSLQDALEKLDGPIRNLAESRDQVTKGWAEVVKRVNDGDLARLIATSTGLALLKRVARQEPKSASLICERAEAVLRRLPREL
jgi:Protein of unknown function N-terminus (DUF3323)